MTFVYTIVTLYVVFLLLSIVFLTLFLRYKISFKLAWYDMWAGAFFDRKTQSVYICFVPCFLITLDPPF